MVWILNPLLFKKLIIGKSLLIFFDDKSSYIISSELLRVESLSAEIQGRSGLKKLLETRVKFW